MKLRRKTKEKFPKSINNPQRGNLNHKKKKKNILQEVP